MSSMQNSMWRILVFLIGAANSMQAKCGKGAYTLSDAKGVIKGPDSWDEAESCSWTFNMASRPTILLLNVTRMKLYYRRYFPFRSHLCTQSLTVGDYAITTSGERCKSEETFCHVYYNDVSCLNLTSAKEDGKKCKVFVANSTKVQFTSNGNSGNHISYPKGFEMSYRYLDCLRETMTLKYIPTTGPSLEGSASSIRVLTTAEKIQTDHTPSHQHPSVTSISRSMSTYGMAGGSQNASVTSLIDGQACNTDNKQRGLNSGGVIGVTIGCLVFMLLLVLISVSLIKKRKQKKDPIEYHEFTSTSSFEVNTTTNGGNPYSPEETGEGYELSTLSLEDKSGKPNRENPASDKTENAVENGEKDSNSDLDKFEESDQLMV